MLGHWIVSQHFMKPEGSIPNSQELSTCSYPEPDQLGLANLFTCEAWQNKQYSHTGRKEEFKVYTSA
jgi:hypothetical protein